MTSSVPKKAYVLLIFFTLLNVINFIDRYLIAAFALEITTDLGITNAQFMLLTGIVFTMFYVTVGVALGVAADRWSRPKLISIGLFVWSVTTAATGFARNFAEMAVARLLIGAGEATLTPTSLSLLSDIFPLRKRAMATGIYYIGVPLGTGLAFMVASAVGDWGWRNCFYFMGGLGLFLWLGMFFVKDPPRGAMEEAHADKGGVEAHASFGAVLKNIGKALTISPALLFVIIGAVITHIGLGATLIDSKWLALERGFTPEKAKAIMGLNLLVAGTIGTLVGGVLADAFQARWPRGGKLYFLVLVQLCAIPFIIGYRFSDPASVVFKASIFMTSLTNFVFYGPVYSAVQDLSPVRVRASMVALLLFAVNFFGVSVGAYATGTLADYYTTIGKADAYTWATFIPMAVAMSCGIFYLLAALNYHSSRQRVIEAERAGLV
jgi:MFS family permease